MASTSERRSLTGALLDRRSEWIALAVIFTQVALVALVLKEFQLQNSAFRRIVDIAAVGFVINHLLPQRTRLAFFALLSIGTTFLVLGGQPNVTVTNVALALRRTSVLLLPGLVLIGVCLLRVGFWARAAALVVVGAVAAAFRANWLPSGNLAIVWPVLAAMFMFRIMVYLYDVSVSPRRPSWNQSLAYFFLIPNVCTLLFPVIDFRTFCSKYYDEEALSIYQRGAGWIVRGMFHLVLYRVVGRLVGLDISNVANGADLVRYVVSNSFLYLKVSGTFHLCVGMLLLFGFNLPETNHRYFLASSFTDYWRRVNTYWRAFIMKVFYYPAFFKLKRLGQTPALVVATLWSFFITWALHAYQAWWINGTVTLRWPDALFWLALALLVLANSLWELKRGRPRKLAATRYSVHDALGLAVRTAATFAVVGVLWSLWSAPSVGMWLFVVSLADWHTLAWGTLVLASVAGATVVFEELPSVWPPPESRNAAGAATLITRFGRAWLQCAALLALVFALGVVVPGRPTPFSAWDTVRHALFDADRVARFDFRRQARGYYESLTEVSSSNQQFWESVRREKFPFDPLHKINVLPWYEFVPNAAGKYLGVDFETNRWGMRGPDCELHKKPGSLRLAFLGSSNVAGYRVLAKDMFTTKLESDLDHELAADGQFEILNFAVVGVGPLGQIAILKNRVPQFQPDIVVYFAHLIDFDWVERDLEEAMIEHLPSPSPIVDQIMKKADVTQNTTEKAASERLRPDREKLLLFAYKQMARQCQAINAIPIYVFLPLPMDLPLQNHSADVVSMLALARRAGFVVVDLSAIYDKLDSADVAVTGDPLHGNAKANAIIAAALFDHLTSDPQIDLLGRARSARDSMGRRATSGPTSR